MTRTESKIINQLLDKYENSKLFRGDNQVAIHISVPFCRSTVPAYFDESSLAAEEINVRMRLLEEEKLIRIVWKNNKPGHIIDKILLCVEHIDEVYQKAGRKPRKEAEVEVLQFLNDVVSSGSGEVTVSFAQRMCERIAAGKTVKEYLDIFQPAQARQIFQALEAVEANRKECYIREFSIEVFHDSKTFERLIPKVCRIFREEKQDYAELEKEDILAEYQIYKAPGYVYLKGPVIISAQNGKQVDVSAFPEGIGLTVDYLLQMPEFIFEEEIETIFTIENLTSFYRFQRERALIIYLGGYHNSSRRRMLQELYQMLPDAAYYHFGDMDAGGFQIFYHLKEKTGIPFQMYGMNLEILQRYRAYAKPLTENDTIRLRHLLEEKMTADSDNNAKRAVEYMLEEKIKLEQECISAALNNPVIEPFS